MKRAALQEVRRVLRSSGRFVLVDFGPPTSQIARVLLTIGHLFYRPDTLRANLAGELPAMLRGADFTGVTEPRPPERFHPLLGGTAGLVPRQDA